ncbi:3983_t:CDS:1, partial [Cetraspora pellucida]
MDNSVIELYLRHKVLHSRPLTKNYADKSIIAFIQNNLHLTSRQLWETLQYQSPTLTQKHVHYWWTVFYKKLYYRNDDQFISAAYLLEEHDGYLLLYSNNENRLFELAFITPFLQLLNSAYDEVLIDATYKTNNAEFELY